MIRVEFTRRTHGDERAMTEAINGLAPQVAATLARIIRRRVEDEGRPAQAAPSYRAVRSGYPVSPTYPVQPAPRADEGKVGRSGAAMWASSETFHRAARVRRGSYSVSGGMWDGLTVQVATPTFARVFFRGRSQGQQVNWRSTKKGRVARGRRVSNALKASSVLRTTGVSLLSLTEGEFQELSAAATAWIARGVDAELWADAQWSSALDVSFFAL